MPVDYLKAAQEARRRVIADLDREVSTVRGWMRTEEHDDLRADFVERLETLAEQRKRHEAMIEG